MTKCPNCFRDLGPDTAAFVCLACPQVVDPLLSASRGVRTVSGPVTLGVRPPGDRKWQLPSQVDCETCLRPVDTEACPDCHFQLPARWRDGRAVCIAAAGARATGKTVYIAVVAKFLGVMAEAMNKPLRPVGSTLEIYQRLYEPFLQRARDLPGATARVTTDNAPQIEPLIWSLGSINGVERYLVIRDAAGEELEDSSRPQHLNFFAHASLVLFLFDPTHVPEVREQLADHLSTAQRVGGDPATVLSNLMAIMGKGHSRLGLVLSKFDTMQAFANRNGSLWQPVMRNAGASFLRDRGPWETVYDDADGAQLDAEVRSMLMRLHATRIVLSVEQPPPGMTFTERFFAVSALGFEPVGNNVHAHGIAPFRVLDPIRWVLAAEGALDWR